MGTSIRTSISTSNQYYISKHEYLMARHFALQYKDWKKEKHEIESRIGYGFNIKEGKSNYISKPIESSIEMSEKYSVRINLIEQSAKIAGGDIWEYILIGVTSECSYEYLRLVKNIPCCKDTYYKMYRKFFYILTHEFYKLLNGSLL